MSLLHGGGRTLPGSETFSLTKATPERARHFTNLL
jgi:hypothetical protein